MFPRAKRFIEEVPQGPPVGSYETFQAEAGTTGAAIFDKAKRFSQNEDEDAAGYSNNKIKTTETPAKRHCGVKPVTNSEASITTSSTRKRKAATCNTNDCSGLEKRIRQLNYERVQQDKELQKLQDEKKRIDSKLNMALQETTKQQSTIASLQKEINDILHKNEGLQREMKSSVNVSKLNQVQAELADINKKLIVKDEELMNTESRSKSAVNALTHQIEEAIAENELLESKTLEIESKLIDVQQNCDDIRQKLSVSQDCKAKLETENASINVEIGQIKMDREKLQNQNSGLAKALSEQESENKVATQTINDLNLKLKNLNDKIEDAQASINELQTKLASMEQALRTSNEENISLRDELHGMSNQVNEAKEEMQNMKASLQQKISSLTEINSKIAGDMQELEENLAESQAHVENCNQELAATENTLIATENTVKDLEQHLKMALEKQTHCESEINKQFSEIEKLQEIKRDSENEITVLKKRLTQLENQNHELTKTIDRYQVDIEIAEENINVRNQRIQTLETEADEAKNSIHSHAMEKQQLKNQVNQITKEVMTLTDSKKSMEETILNLKAEVYTMQEQLAARSLIIAETEGMIQMLKDEFKKNEGFIEQEMNSLLEKNRLALEALTNEKKNATNRQQQLLNELAEKKELIEDLQFENTNMKRNINELSENLNELKNAVLEKDKRYDELGKMYDEVKAESTHQIDLVTGQLVEAKKLAEAHKMELESTIEDLQKVSQWELKAKESITEINNLKKDITACRASMESEVHKFNNSLTAAKEEVIATYQEKSQQYLTESLQWRTEAEKWKTMYENLNEMILPFKAQLEEYEEEKKLLLYQNKEATKEVNQLSKNYAKLLGHQNNKQKIQHIKRIKEENLRLKQEVVKLQDQLDKEKRSTRKLENQILHETTNTFDRLATPLKPCINSGNIMKTTSVKKSR